MLPGSTDNRRSVFPEHCAAGPLQGLPYCSSSSSSTKAQQTLNCLHKLTGLFNQHLIQTQNSGAARSPSCLGSATVLAVWSFQEGHACVLGRVPGDCSQARLPGLQAACMWDWITKRLPVEVRGSLGWPHTQDTEGCSGLFRLECCGVT